MADYTVTPVFDLMAHTRVTHDPGESSSNVLGAARAPAEGSILASIWMYHALHEATVNTNPGTFFVQTRGEAVNDQWMNVAQFLTSNGTAATSALDATEAIGVTEISITSSASFAAGDYIYIDDADGVAEDEWHHVAVIDGGAGTDLTLAEGLVAAKASGDDAWTGAEGFFYPLDLRGVFEYRVIYIHQGAVGADTAVWVTAVEATDFE